MDEEPVYVTAGKEFGFIRSANGKVKLIYFGFNLMFSFKMYTVYY